MLIAKERIATIRLLKSIERNPLYAEKIGIKATNNNILFKQIEESKRDQTQRKS